MSGKERLNVIFRGDPADLEDAIALVRRELPAFDRGPERLGWGWHHRVPSGRTYFLRQIKGGVSATMLEPER